MWEYVGSIEFSPLDFMNPCDRDVQGLVYAKLIHSADYIIPFYAVRHWHNTPETVSVYLTKQSDKTSKKGRMRADRFNFSFLVLW